MTIQLTKRRLLRNRRSRVSCMVVCHNEMEKLEAFFAYYRSAGVTHFFFVDNGSTDGTLEYLLDQRDTSVFVTLASYGQDNKGLKWSRRLADEYLNGKWVLTVDVDEIFVWPGYPQVSLQEYLSYCDKYRIDAALALMVDFFPKPGAWASFRGRSDFLSVASNYCHEPFAILTARHFPNFQVKGGVRSVMIGDMATSPVLQKMPLLRWRRGRYYLKSTHYYSHVTPLSDMMAVLAHFKFSGESQDKFKLELERGQRWNKGAQYKRYLRAVETEMQETLASLDVRSVTDYRDLYDHGFLKISERYAEYLAHKCRVEPSYLESLPKLHKPGFEAVKNFWRVISRLNGKQAYDFVDPEFAYHIDDVEIV